MEELFLALASVDALVPQCMLDPAALAGRPPGGQHVVGHGEFVRLEAEFGARRFDLFPAQRRAMRRRRALLVWSAVADDGPAADQSWARIGNRLFDRPADILAIEAVALGRVPLRRPVPGNHVL